MDMQAITNLITQTGIWCVTAYIIGKMFVDYIKKDKENDRADFKEEKARMYAIMDKQNELQEQQREILARQTAMSEHNKQMLDKLTDIQMLHTNRLDRIEDRLGRLEEKSAQK